jgi:hypothetical protein
MTKALTVALALIAGLMGGLLARYIAPPAVFAQNQPAIAKDVRSQSFTLVDPSDRVVGTFTAEPVPGANPMRLHRNPQSPNNQSATDSFVPAYIVLRDSNGNRIWSAGGGMIRPLSER